MPEATKDDFDVQLEPYLALSHPIRRNGNNRAREALKGKIMQVHGFCFWHREQEMLDKIKQSGVKWPAMIDRQLLPGRIQDILPVLIKLALDPRASVVFQGAENIWHQKGRAYCLSNPGKWDASQLFGLG